jgi:hypothetical protein
MTTANNKNSPSAKKKTPLTNTNNQALIKILKENSHKKNR